MIKMPFAMPYDTDSLPTRREFLQLAAVGPIAARVHPFGRLRRSGASAGQPASQVRPLRLGGPIFLKSDDPAELAREHRRLGYSAAYCPAAKPDDSARCRVIRDAFKAENVVIA